MNRILPFLVLSSFVCLPVSVARAETEANTIECVKSRTFLAPLDSSEHRKYAPDREVDILHLALDVTPDFKQRTVSGKATLRFKPIARPVQELRLDAVDLSVESVTATEKLLGYQVTEKEIIVTFADLIPPDKEASVTVTYRAEPRQGLYFRTPEMGYKEGDTHLFTQGEEIEARHWYPCFDSPNEKFTSEIICHAPEGMTVLSNGRLVSEEKDANGLVTARWLQDKPHVNYLISLVAGYLKKVEDKYKDIPLAFYTPASEINEASTSFRDTKDMMAFFEQEIGVPYPWAKYYQVCVNDFVAGGMENTSITTLTDSTLFTADFENVRTSQGLVAHELVHQWFGDLVTCKDWSHIWLNEGFATYYESLYEEHKNGRDAMLYELYQRARNISGISNDTNAIVRRTYDSPGDMFNYLAYPKGGWVLHMLRSQLGEELYRRCIKTYVERHQYQNVVTDDLRAVIEELSGRSYDQFFDQWVYHAHHPELEAAYSFDAKSKLAKLTIKQTQKLSDDALLFHFPLTVRFKGSFGTVDREVVVKEKEEDFYFALDAAPTIVRIDPNYTLLAKVTFNVPNAMLHAQLADNEDAVGRLFAIQQLSGKKDKESVAKLKDRLNNDPFYGVRVEASRALRSIHTDEALDALLASTSQSDARVRRQVVDDIGSFYRDTVYAAARKTLDAEKNPDILSEAIQVIGGYGKPETRDVVLKFLNSESYRNTLAGAAIRAVRLQDDPSYIRPLIDTLFKRQSAFTSGGFGAGLETLGYIARSEQKRDEPREFLMVQVTHPKRPVRLAAIRALEALGDPKALAVLRTFASASKETPERGAAERAVTALRAGRKPVDDFKNLRNEVLELQKQSRDLRKELDDLKKKVEPAEAQPAETKSKKKPSALRK